MKAIIFDMDGVLVDTFEYHYRSWKKVAVPLGITFSRDDNNLLRGLSRSDSLEVILAGRNVPASEKAILLQRKNDYFTEYINKMSSKDLSPGVKRLLQELRDAQIPAGISSSSKNVQAILKKLEIEEFIGAVGDGNCVLDLKPNPAVFLYTAAALGVDPEDCLVIEDGRPGIAAGLEAGMCVVGVGPDAVVSGANAILPDLSIVRLEDLQEIYMSWYLALKSPEMVFERFENVQ